MKQYYLKVLDIESLRDIRHKWSDNDEDSAIRIQTTIDQILFNNAYGEPTQRSNLQTYMAIIDENTEIVEGLVEIISSEVGKARICKIMDFMYSPSFEQKNDEDYVISRLTMLIAALIYVTQAVMDKGAGHSKIYARDDAAQHIIASVQKILENKENEIGLKVTTNGRQWLKFEPVDNW